MTEGKNVTIIDYNCGNLKSVEQAFLYCGANVSFARTPRDIALAEKLVLPGVGAYPIGMENLHLLDLVKPIKDKVANGTPILGICLGMQLLFDCSHEHGGAKGLGLIEGCVKSLRDIEPNAKLPNVGWSQVSCQRRDRINIENSYYYFVHSYHVIPKDTSTILATSSCGNIHFCAAVSRDRIWGVQFHPENSHKQGLALIDSFISL